MNNEQQELLDEVYDNYTQTKIVKNDDGTETHTSPIGHYNGMTKEKFINKIKTDNEFSEKWGLTIEERELDQFERWGLANLTPNMSEIDWCNKFCDEQNIPTKLITITYNDKIIESYE
jgi:hypothetical protein